jgi:peptidoglycan/LPS O-acetylase OafA/YrhL
MTMPRKVPAAGESPGATVASTIHMDAIRGAAALAVVAFHIRYKFFLDYSEAVSTAWPTRLFYVATSFGHDAVMVFFVLSGYLITGTVLKDVKADRWSWSRYLLNRLTRLYVVLIPGLLLTVAWDLLGLHLFPAHPAYTGATQVWKHDFFDVRATLTPSIFFANAVFRDAIAGIPPLGSNSPLWSLTYEFAYYMIFPAALLALRPRAGVSMRALYGLMAAALIYYFGRRILLYFPIWLMGLAVRVVPPRPTAGVAAVRLRNLAAVVLVLACTAFRHTALFQRLAGNASLEIGDFVVGLAFAAALYVLLLDARPDGGGVYDAVARGGAHISYTVYVVHMPFLIFVRALLNDGPQWSFDAGTAMRASAVFAATLAYATVAWYCFEARTPIIRNAASQRFGAFRALISSGV